MATEPTKTLSEERDRTRIPDCYTWNTSDLYASDQAWREAKSRLVSEIPALAGYRGRLGISGRTLLECLTALSHISKEHARLSVYANLIADADTRLSGPLAMVQEMSQIGSEIAAATAFVQPDILALGGDRIDAFIREEPGLTIYRHDLDDILRRKDHTGTAGEEKILADATLMADGPDSIYGIFSNADFPFPEVVLSDGKAIRLDKAAFSLYRSVPNRRDREAVFHTYFSSLHAYRRTFGAQLYAQVKRDMFSARARKYSSCLHSALDSDHIPVDVYTTLLRNVREHLDTFHRYLTLRKALLGLDELHYYDLYCPIVPRFDLEYSYEEAQEHVLASLAPLGDEYRAVVKTAFDRRWVDVSPGDGKRSGAYSNGAAYDVHPYILMNYNGKYDDVSTLTHELGHTMHSHLSNTHQPYPTSRYSIFVAEVASTLNEALLLEHMLATIDDDALKLSLLGNYLDGIRGTVFRQTQFAEFELRIHEMAEGGETLTGDELDLVYGNLTREYYGQDQGICIVDDEINTEWAHIPHFYYNFYVFQYATSFTASAAISERILAGDQDAVRRYMDLLASGGSDYPIVLLKNAGVDMTSAEPFMLTMRKMNRVMEEMEKIVGRLQAKREG